MKDHMEAYHKKLKKGICEYMDMPVSERTANAVHAMLQCLEEVEKKMGGAAFTMEDAKKWAEYMVNDDGTMGAHWTMEQTSAVADSMGVKMEHIYDYDWWITMNMMYSDYCGVAKQFGVDTAEFFAEIAKAFLFDKDGGEPPKKLAAYYHGIVCPKDKY